MMKSPGIHMRFLLAVWVMILVIVVLLGTFGGKVTEQFMRERFHEHMGTLARYLALNVELGIILEDREMLDRLCNNLLQENDIVAVSVERFTKEPLVQVQKSAFFPAAPEVRQPVMRSSRLEENLIYETGENSPSLADQFPLGWVVIHYSNERSDEVIKQMKQQFLAIIISVVLFFNICFYWISRSLVSPLKKLVQATHEVAKGGNLNVKVDGGHLPETRILASSFQEMLSSLAQSRAELDRTYQEMLRQQALAELGKFSMMVAHEVKNPLGIIQGALDILKKPEIPETTRSTMMIYVENELKRLNRLVEDFLRFARPRPPQFERIDLHALLMETINRFYLDSGNGAERIYTEIPSIPLWGEVDADLISQALSNVMKNALEASAPTGRVWISSSFCNDHWRILARDEGPGVPPEHREHIFEPFYTTKSQGTGLGLALVARVIQQHGGTIEIVDMPEGGGCFQILLPVTREACSRQLQQTEAESEAIRIQC